MSKLDHKIYVESLQRDMEAMSTVIPSGSYFISGVKNSDIDFFVEAHSQIRMYLEKNGFVTGFEEADASFENDAKFISYKKGVINVICVRGSHDLHKIKLATDLCKALKLKTKEQRLFVFNTLRLGKVSNKRSTELE